MGLIPEEEKKRYFIQLALQGGEEYWDEETQFVQEGSTISLYANICYVLALVSSKQREYAEEAQRLLTRILPFQIPFFPHQGAFPKYLHQYPYPKDRRFQQDLCRVLEELGEHHTLALGQKLSDKLRRAIKKLKKYLVLQGAEERVEREEVVSTNSLALRLFPLKGTSEVYEKYSVYWNPSLMCYTGPCLDEYYEKGEIKRSLFDYLMCSYYGVYPTWLKKKDPLKLQGALIPYFPSQREFHYPVIHGHYRNRPWSVWNGSHDALFLFHHFSPEEPHHGGLHLLRYLWKEEKTLHHLVCQCTHKEVEAAHEKDITTLTFTYPLTSEKDEEERVEFFVKAEEGLEWKVENRSATVFYLKDRLCLHASSRVLEWVFSIEEGEGDVIGHISKGSPPSHCVDKEAKHEAFHWRISLRVLRRDPHFKIRWQMTRKLELSCSQIQDCLERLPSHEGHYPHIESHQ